MSDRPTISEVVEFQMLHEIEAHVVWLDDRGFVIAHTESERRDAAIMREELEFRCELHRWLEEQEGSPVWEDGYYIAVPHEPDAYSEPYGADSWDFEKIKP